MPSKVFGFLLVGGALSWRLVVPETLLLVPSAASSASSCSAELQAVNVAALGDALAREEARPVTVAFADQALFHRDSEVLTPAGRALVRRVARLVVGSIGRVGQISSVVVSTGGGGDERLRRLRAAAVAAELGGGGLPERLLRLSPADAYGRGAAVTVDRCLHASASNADS